MFDTACARTAIRDTCAAAEPGPLRRRVGRNALHGRPEAEPARQADAAWPQEKLHGMARRSSIAPCRPPRRRSRADIQLGDLGDRRRAEEIVDKARRLVDELPIGRHAALPKSAPPRRRTPAARSCRQFSKRRFERRRDQRLEIAPADVGIGVFRRDHLALLGQPDLAVHRARRLRQDGLIARAAAAPDRTAAAMEQP